MSNFLNVDPTRDNRLQKQLEYAAICGRKFTEQDTPEEYWQWVADIKRIHYTSGGTSHEGQRILDAGAEQYAIVDQNRKIHQREAALATILLKWVKEQTPVSLIFSGAAPELAMGFVIKFSGFENPGSFVLLKGPGYLRKMPVSHKWSVSENEDGEKISSDPYEITAAKLSHDAITKLFELPADLLSE